ncbi:MAG: dihydrodipicolinate synthase family protein [Bacilli bacterium]
MIGQVINALVTPFDENGEIDYDEVKNLLSLGNENCNDAFVIGSTTGEGTSLSLKEKRDLYIFCRNNTSLECIYALNAASFNKAKEEYNNIKDLNIEYFLIVTPFYVLPSQDGLLIYYRELAKLLSPSKIIMYNVPKRTGVNLSFYTIKKLIKTCPNIIGLKECSTDKNLIHLLKKNFSSFLVFIGNDDFIYEGISAGADGIVSVLSIVYGKEIQSIIKDYKYGIKADLLISYMKFISSIVFASSNPCGIKHLLEKRGEKSMNLRLPLVKLSSYDDSFNILL